MFDKLTDEDLREIRHINDGGRFCLDGRKERRLFRMGMIEYIGGTSGGYRTTPAGRAVAEES